VRTPPQLRGGPVTRATVLVSGLLVFSSGIVAMLDSRLGLSPWDVFHQGLAQKTPLSFGGANIAVSIAVVTVAWLLGARIGIATLANAVLVGTFVQLLSSLAAVADLASASLPTRVALLVIGLALMGAGTGLYLGANLGAGPRDSLMVVGAARTRYRIGAVRGALEFGALAAGFVLGGTVGIGTIVFAVGIGPAVEGSFWLLACSPLAEQKREVSSPESRYFSTGPVVAKCGNARDA
jgi:uncharacterized membrane protein YczE